MRLYIRGEHGGISASTINRALDQLHRGLLALAKENKAPSEAPDFTYSNLSLGSLNATYAPAHPESDSELEAIRVLVPGLEHVGSARSLPPGWNYEALKYVHSVVLLWNQGGAEGALIQGPSGTVKVGAELANACEEALSGEEKSLGVVAGQVHEWKQYLRGNADRLTVRDESSDSDVHVLLPEGVVEEVKSLISERILARGILSRGADSVKRQLVARSVEIAPELDKKRSIMDHAGVMGPLPDDADVVEWQRRIREA